MADKPPFFKLDPAQFLQDVVVDAMSTEELGAAMRLLCRQWIDGWIPDDIDLLARLCRMNRSAMEQAWPVLAKFFPEIEPGKRANRFMWVERETVMASMRKRQDDGRTAVNRRWDAMRQAKQGNSSPIPDLIQDKDIDKDIDTPPTPPKGAKGKGRGRKLDDALLEVPDVAPEDVATGRAIIALVPPADPEDGRKITNDARKVVMRLVAIRQRQPLFCQDVMLEAARAYYTAPRRRYKSAEHFLSLEPEPSTGKPPFHEFASAEVNRRRMAAAQPAPAPLIPEEAHA